MTSGERREHLRTLLEERGMHTASSFSENIHEQLLHSAIAVVDRWDKREGKTTGLLFTMLEQDVVFGYKPISERKSAEAEAEEGTPQISERLIQSVRTGCKTPDGLTRDEARSMYDTAARARGVPVDELIDMAMGTEWLETKPHPAKDPENPDKQAAYRAWLA